MKIQIKLDKEDWRKYQSYIERELPKSLKSGTNSVWLNMFFWMIVAAVFMIIFRQNYQFHWPTAISVSVFFVLIFALFLFNISKVRKAFEPSEKGTFCGEHTFLFSDEGIVTMGEGYSGQHSWEIVKKVERVQGLILIFVDTAYAYVFPEEKLENPDEFYNHILQQRSSVT